MSTAVNWSSRERRDLTKTSMARPVGSAPPEDSLRRRPVAAAGSELIVDDVVVGCGRVLENIFQPLLLAVCAFKVSVT